MSIEIIKEKLDSDRVRGLDLASLRYSKYSEDSMEIEDKCANGSGSLKCINKLVDESDVQYIILNDQSSIKIFLRDIQYITEDSDINYTDDLEVKFANLKLFQTGDNDKTYTFYENYGYIPTNIFIREWGNQVDTYNKFIIKNFQQFVNAEYEIYHIFEGTEGNEWAENGNIKKKAVPEKTALIGKNKVAIIKYCQDIQDLRKSIKDMPIDASKWREEQDKIPCVEVALEYLEDKQEIIVTGEVSENDILILQESHKSITELEKILKQVKVKGQAVEIYNTIFEGHFDNLSHSLHILNIPFIKSLKYNSEIGNIEEFIKFYKISLNYLITNSNIGISLNNIDSKIWTISSSFTYSPQRYIELYEFINQEIKKIEDPNKPDSETYRYLYTLLDNKSYFSDAQINVIETFNELSEDKKNRTEELEKLIRILNNNIEQPRDLTEETAEINEYIEGMTGHNNQDNVKIIRILHSKNPYIIKLGDFLDLVFKLWIYMNGLIKEKTKNKTKNFLLKLFFGVNEYYTDEKWENGLVKALGLMTCGEETTIPELAYLYKTIQHENVRFNSKQFEGLGLGLDWGKYNTGEGCENFDDMKLVYEDDYKIHRSFLSEHSGEELSCIKIIIHYKEEAEDGAASGPTSNGGGITPNQNKYELKGGGPKTKKLLKEFQKLCIGSYNIDGIWHYKRLFNSVITNTSVILRNKYRTLFHSNPNNTKPIQTQQIKFENLIEAKITQSLSFYLQLVENGDLDLDRYIDIKTNKIYQHKSIMFKIFGDLYNKYKRGKEYKLSSITKSFLRQNYELYESYYRKYNQESTKIAFLDDLKFHLF